MKKIVFRKYYSGRKNKYKGATLIEMLVVIVIIGLLAAIAIPMYTDYTIKSKLVEVTNAIGYVVTALNSYHHDRIINGDSNVWPDCGNIADIQTSLGVGLSGIGRIRTASVDPQTGTISVTVTNIHAKVNDTTITLTPSINPTGSSLSWKWGGTIPPQFLPKQ